MNNNAIELSASSEEFVNLFNRILLEYERSQHEWIDRLRGKDVRAAHPDDGWVDRVRNSVRFSYPAFNDGVEVGSTIALGDHRKYRLVLVTRISLSRHFANELGLRYEFVEVKP